MVNFPNRILNYDSHSPVLLDLFISSDTNVCPTTASPIGKFWSFCCLSFHWFPLNSKGNALFHCVAYGYSHADWDGLRDHLRDAPGEDISKLGTSTTASEFWKCGFRLELVYISLTVKLHSSPWFTAACAVTIAHRNHFFSFIPT